MVKMLTIRCLIALATHHKWPIYQLDFTNAFLHEDLHEEVYMKVYVGFHNPHNHLCKLRKSLYGLKQAFRQCFVKLVTKLLLKVFQSKNDHNLFIKRSEQHITITDVYVDDIILSSKYMSSITTLKTHLHNTFSIKDMRIFHYFLGIEVGEGVVRKRKDC